MKVKYRYGLLVWWLVLLAATGRADEGMWLFTDPPRDVLKTKYDFTATPEWLEHLQKSSVRFSSGGSGSFVSAAGLVLTNHHVGSEALQELSDEEHDYLSDGFYAPTMADEPKCLDLELNVLMEIEDVTDRVKAVVAPSMTAAEAEQARRGVMNTIEQESLVATGLKSEVVTLYRGGRYHLYRYKRYDDVRLVFAPEQKIAFFGGDVDNFEYPRHNLDICFFRAYENGRPAQVTHYLDWSPHGAGAGELVFVSGHPGSTGRLNTVAHLEYMRDRHVPFVLNCLRRKEVLLSTFSQRSDENARRAQDELHGVQNSRKAYLGELAGLQEPALFEMKRKEENLLRGGTAEAKATAGDPWAAVSQSLEVYAKVLPHHFLIERGMAFDSELFSMARTLVRLAEETAKPNAERLREYRESNLPSLRRSLVADTPIYADFETVKLADSLSMLVEMAGSENGLVRECLAGKSPRARAAQLVSATRLADAGYRKQLADAGAEAIVRADDPMIALARLVEPTARRYRKVVEEEVEEPQRQAYERLAELRFQRFGTSVYPDATFTLRLAFGTVLGYEETTGRTLPPWTTLADAFRRAETHGSQPPFELPASWIERRERLDLATPFNFVSTADIIGGNSGSPVVNRKGQFVGIIFDGNLESLVWDYIFDDRQGRAISVDSRAIVAALRGVYNAQRVLEELGQ